MSKGLFLNPHGDYDMTHYTAIENRKIRIAIVGCGRISKNHFGSIDKHQNSIELVAICDNNKAFLKSFIIIYSSEILL